MLLGTGSHSGKTRYPEPTVLVQEPGEMSSSESAILDPGLQVPLL